MKTKLLINTSEITQFRVLKEEFISFHIPDEFYVVPLDESNYTSYLNELQLAIDYYHNDITWDGIPSLSDVEKRFQSNSTCLLFYWNDICIGWRWNNPNVTINFIDINTVLLKNEMYIGNTFVTKSVERPKLSGLYLHNLGVNYWFNNTDYDIIYNYIENWHNHSIELNVRNGFTKFNFLN